MLLSAAPTDPGDQFAQTLAAYERRIADLERTSGRLNFGGTAIDGGDPSSTLAPGIDGGNP